MLEKARILQVGDLPPAAVEALDRAFRVERSAAAGIHGIATSGKAPIDAALLKRLPDLEIVSCLGAGTEGVDLAAAAARGIEVANTAHVLAADVADIAMGLVIGLARDFRGADRFVRTGAWAGGKYPLGAALRGARLGILGLGTIGSAVAHRAEAFGMTIGYHVRRPRADCAYEYFADLVEMARWCRFLVVACPGGAATRHLVDARILEAIGPEGFLVNVARGSVVDEAALAAALAGEEIAGAGLDVFEDEPHPLPALVASERTLLLPHIGSATHETRGAMIEAMVEALRRRLLNEG
jgi:hydroxypyruvate reductase